jgi:type VI secretion system protein ImpB
MSGDISVAPKERVNIVYRSKPGNVEQDVELPLKLMVMGDFKTSEDQTPMEDRKPEPINQNNFNDVLKSQNLHLDMEVPDEISGEGNMTVSLDFKSMNDFNPDAIVQNDNNLKKIQELRNALVSLKSPLGNTKEFKEKLQEILDDEDKLNKLLEELDLDDDGNDEEEDE